MNKLNGTAMTQIEKSNICLNMALRINSLFVEAENEVEFKKQDIVDILGTCIRNITGEHGVLCLTGDAQARPEFNAYLGKTAIHSASPSNNTCLIIDEQGRTTLSPLFQIKSEPESQINLNITLSEPSEEERKYLAKYLAKETPAQGITIQAESKQEQHQEKMNLINDAKGRALNILFHERIDKDVIMAQSSWVKIIIIAVSRLFSGLDASDKNLNAKLDMLVDALCNKYSSVIPFDDDFETAKKTVIKRVAIIRKNIDLIFFQLD